MLGKYVNKIFKGNTETKVDRRTKERLLLAYVPNKFITEHKKLRHDSNPVTRAAFVTKMLRLHKLKAANPHSSWYAENLLMFIEFVKKDFSI